MSVDLKTISEAIKSKAKDLGFLDCGIAQTRFLIEHQEHLENWLQNNMNGEMRYMENHKVKRLDPRELVEGSKSVISVLFNYYTDKIPSTEDTFRISRYAYGKDYHFVIKELLLELFDFTKLYFPDCTGRAFVDSAPVLDRAWAVESGLGWIGKNSNLIHPKYGSFFFIAELIIDKELSYDSPLKKNYCGNCTRCIDSCPTRAIVRPQVVDGSQCISYATIEYKGDKLPSQIQAKLGNRIFGCDICQEVCPWNKKAKAHKCDALLPHPQLLVLDNEQWQNLDKKTFNEIFRKSAVKRTGYKGLLRNIRSVSS